jgi:hypothetical protein
VGPKRAVNLHVLTWLENERLVDYAALNPACDGVELSADSVCEVLDDWKRILVTSTSPRTPHAIQKVLLNRFFAPYTSHILRSISVRPML